MVLLHFCVFCILAEVFICFDKLCKIEQLVSHIHLRVWVLMAGCTRLLHNYQAI